MIVLDARLTAVRSLVRPGSRIADVGTDHGYLAADLLLKGLASFAFACDIHQKPLERARQTFARYGLEEKTKLFCTDGLSGLPQEEIDDVIIAGMGGDMILHILEGAGWKDVDKRFVLQPMTKIPMLRQALYAQGYEILKEQAAREKGFSYTAMQVRWCGEKKEISRLSAWTGKLPQAPSLAAAQFLQVQIKTLRAAAEGKALGSEKQSAREDFELAQQLEEVLCQMQKEREITWP